MMSKIPLRIATSPFRHNINLICKLRNPVIVDGWSLLHELTCIFLIIQN